MASEVNFQSKDYKFPKRGYLCALWVTDDEGELKFLYFLNALFSKIADCKKEYLHIRKELGPKMDKRFTPNIIFIAELVFNRLGALTKDLWDSPVFEYKRGDRDIQLFEAVTKKELYEILVTPSESSPKFRVAYAFKKNSEEELDLFMKTSNWYVDPEAKHIGIYRVGKTFGLHVIEGHRVGISPKLSN